jgi:trk system potassium uptake protein TrkH
VLTGLDHLPLSINVWRCFMVLLGGMGIIVLAVAILPLLGVGGSQIFKAETPGPMKDEKLTPRIAETARGLWVVYFALATVCFFAYHLAGMGWADAFLHMCSTMGLGGFSRYDASFGAFDSPAIEGVAIVFMLLSGVNFALYFLVWKRRSILAAAARPGSTRLAAAVCGRGGPAVTVYLLVHGTYPTLDVALRHAAFNVISIATTTGYASVDYAQWPIIRAHPHAVPVRLCHQRRQHRRRHQADPVDPAAEAGAARAHAHRAPALGGAGHLAARWSTRRCCSRCWPSC